MLIYVDHVDRAFFGCHVTVCMSQWAYCWSTLFYAVWFCYNVGMDGRCMYKMMIAECISALTKSICLVVDLLYATSSMCHSKFVFLSMS